MRKKTTTTTTKSLFRRGRSAHGVLCHCVAAVLLALLLPVQAMADEAWAEFNSSDGTLTFRYGAKPTSFDEGTTAYSLNTGNNEPGWNANANAVNIKSVVFDESFASARPTSCFSWFGGCQNLSSITGLEHLNTENVTCMITMFGGCSSLETLDLSKFNTEKVEYMDSMFYGCVALESITFSSDFKTDNVIGMCGMFRNCSSLTSLDLTSFNTAKVEDMSWMFGIENVCFWDYGSALQSITWTETLDTKKVTDMKCMFCNCYNLETLDVSNFNTENVTNMYSMFFNCGNLTTLNVSNFDTKEVTDMCAMFEACCSLESITLPDNFNTANVEDMSWMFSDCSSLTSLDLSGFNTANVEDMSWMFSGCSSLTSLDLTNFNTANVKDMERMFEYCEALQSIDLSGFNTANVEDMSWMFAGCSSLTDLDVSNFNTANVKGMSCMFAGCSNLETLDVSNFNTANVRIMPDMFSGCSGLTSIDLTSFNTENVGDMSCLFRYCSNLTTVYVGEEFVIRTFAFTYYMFEGCAEEGAEYGYFKTYYRVGDTQHDLWGETLSVDELVLEDGKDFVAHAPFIAATARYSRAMANTWGTLCLPYAIDADDNATCDFYALGEVKADELVLAKLSGEIAAGTPVVVRRRADAAAIDVNAANTAVVTAPAADESGRLAGTFVEMEVGDGNYIVANDHFWLVDNLKSGAEDVTAVMTKGFRAYVTDRAGGSVKANRLGITTDEATGIGAIDALNSPDAAFYDIQGRRTGGLQKGLNIVRTGDTTRKIMVK